MKINILDVCHETICDETEESIILSIKNVGGTLMETRTNINYNEMESNLIEFCASSMKNSPQVKEFFLKVTDLYFHQDL